MVTGLCVLGTHPAKAQCATCALNVESNARSGSVRTSGLNMGILYLLAAPFIAVGVGGYVWHRNYKRKEIRYNVRNEKLNLN